MSIIVFFYHLCPECEFDMITSQPGPRNCPLCREDSGHCTTMTTRPATDADKPEGKDERAS